MKTPIKLYDLAMHMGVTPSTMSISIDRIMKLGYVKKEKDQKDARRTNLTLTYEGNVVKQSRSVLDSDRVENLLNQLTLPEREQAIGGLRLLAAAAQKEMTSKSLNKTWTNRNKK